MKRFNLFAGIAGSTWIAVLLLGFAGRAVAVDLIGYVPYYRMSSDYVNNTLPGQLAMLDEVRYFGVTVNSDGGLSTTAADLNHIQSIKSIIDGMPASKRPRLGITIGGDGASSGFSTVAANSTLRDQFAQNLSALLDQTGATGIDLDWEHPSAGTERNTLYPAMLTRVKQEFGVDRRVYATVAPTVVISKSIFTGPHAVDGVSLMTYDLGWWSSDPSNSHTGEHSLNEYVEDAVEAWTDTPGSPNQRPWVFGTWGNSAPAEKLGVGLPFYGRSFDGSGANVGVEYSDLVAGGTTIDGSAYQYNGSNVWIPGLDQVEQRVEYAAAASLQSMIIWEMAQDLNPADAKSMLKTAYETKLRLERKPADFDGNGSVDREDLIIWAGAFGLGNGGDTDADNDTDAADFLTWQRQLTASSLNMIAIVPEPTSVVLGYACVLIYASGRCSASR